MKKKRERKLNNFNNNNNINKKKKKKVEIYSNLCIVKNHCVYLGPYESHHVYFVECENEMNVNLVKRNIVFVKIIYIYLSIYLSINNIVGLFTTHILAKKKTKEERKTPFCEKGKVKNM